MALLLWYMSGRQKYAALAPAVPIVLLVGVFSALLSCITGMLLSSGGDYDSSAVNWHMWMGISTTVVSAWLYSQLRSNQPRRTVAYTSAGVLFLVGITGHLGGNLTHGSDFLTGALTGPEDAEVRHQRPPIPDVQKAVVFTDIIQPILADKCYGCHGARKEKGRLRMDQPALLMQGGKHGVIIVAGHADTSELIKRIKLPAEDDHHMAPKEKPQITKQEMALLSWWIDQGASLTAHTSELKQPAEIRPALLALKNGGDAGDDDQSLLMKNDEIPNETVPPAAAQDLAAIRAKGAMVEAVAANVNYLRISCPNGQHIDDSFSTLLRPLKQQLISLKLSGTAITDEGLKQIGQLQSLIRLDLDGTRITDQGLPALQKLSKLKFLNLAVTNITGAGLETLKPLDSLKRVYLYKSKVDRSQWGQWQGALKGVQLDSGGYQVPTLPTDTQLVRPAPAIKK